MVGKFVKKISRPRIRLIHPKAIEMTKALGLGQWHLRLLREKFDEIDVDNSGNIDPEEFFESMDEERSMLTDELFRMTPGQQKGATLANFTKAPISVEFHSFRLFFWTSDHLSERSRSVDVFFLKRARAEHPR